MKLQFKNGEVCELGKNKYLTYEDIKENLAKTGDVPFVINNIKYDIDDKVFTRISNLNKLRRKAFEKLSEEIIKSFKNNEVVNEVQNINGVKVCNRNVETKIAAYVYRLDLLENLESLSKFDRVYISLEDSIKYENKLKELKIDNKLYIYLPTITNAKYKEYIAKNIDKLRKNQKILVSNVEHLKMFENENMEIAIDNGFNVFNSKALNVFANEKTASISLSNELSLNQIENIFLPNDVSLEIDIYGNLQAMYSNFCILKANNKCGLCKNISYNLVDRKGKKFPCLFNNISCTMQVLNTDKLFSNEAAKRLYGKVDYMRMYIYNEKEEEITKVINSIRGISQNEIMSNENTKYTNGAFFREV